MPREMRFFRPITVILALILVSAGVLVLFGPVGEGLFSPPLPVLVGAVSCSLAIFLVLFLLQPIGK